MTLQEIISETGYSKASIYRWMALEGFPQPWNAPRRPRRWKRDEVEKWLEENGLGE